MHPAQDQTSIIRKHEMKNAELNEIDESQFPKPFLSAQRLLWSLLVLLRPVQRQINYRNNTGNSTQILISLEHPLFKQNLTAKCDISDAYLSFRLPYSSLAAMYGAALLWT